MSRVLDSFGYLPISKAINICKASKFPKTSDDSVTCSKGAVDDAQAQIIQITGPTFWRGETHSFEPTKKLASGWNLRSCSMLRLSAHIYIYLHSVYYMYIQCVYDIDIDIYIIYSVYVMYIHLFTFICGNCGFQGIHRYPYTISWIQISAGHAWSVTSHTVDGRNPAPPGMYKTL